MKLLQSGAQSRAVLDTVISKLMAPISSKPAQLDCASLLKPYSVPEPLWTKCLFIQHILNVVKSSCPSLMDGNGLNNASGTYCRNWWFLLLCIPGVSWFPCAAQTPLLDPTRWQEGKPKKQKWVSGVDWECGSLLSACTGQLWTHKPQPGLTSLHKITISLCPHAPWSQISAGF